MARRALTEFTHTLTNYGLFLRIVVYGHLFEEVWIVEVSLPVRFLFIEIPFVVEGFNHHGVICQESCEPVSCRARFYRVDGNHKCTVRHLRLHEMMRIIADDI